MPNEQYKVEYIYGAQSLKSFDKMLEHARKTAKSMDKQMKAISKTYDKTSNSAKKMTLALDKSSKTAGKYRTNSNSMIKTNLRLASSNLKTADSLKKQGEKLKSYGENVTTVGRAMTVFSATALAAFVGALKTGKDFETQFAGVVKTVSDGTPRMSASIQNFRKDMLGLLNDLPIASSELNKIAEIGGQMGIPINNLKTFTEVVAKLGIATNITGEEGAEMIGKFMNVMAIKPTERNMREFGDVIVALGNAMNGTENDIMMLANRLAGASSMIKMSQKDTLALASSMAAVGIRAEMGGGAFQRVALQIQDMVDEGGKGLNKLASISNMTAEQFVKGWKSKPLETFIAFEKGIKATGDQGAAVFRSLFRNNTRDLQMVLKLANGYEQLELARRTANEAASQGGNLSRESAIRFQTLDSKLQLLKNSFTVLSVEITDKFGNVIKDFIGNFTNFIKGFTSWIKSLDENSVRIVSVVSLITAGLGPATIALGGFMKVAGSYKIIKGTLLGNLEATSKKFIKTKNSSDKATKGVNAFLAKMLRVNKSQSLLGTGVSFVKGQFTKLNAEMAASTSIGQGALTLLTSFPVAAGIAAVAIGGIGLAWYIAGQDMRKARDLMGDAADTMVNSWNTASKGSQALKTSLDNIRQTYQNVTKDITLLSTVVSKADVNYGNYVSSINDSNTTLIENSKKVVEERIRDYALLVSADNALTQKQKDNEIARQTNVYNKDIKSLNDIEKAWSKAFASKDQKQMIEVSKRLGLELEKQGMLAGKNADSFVAQAKNMRMQGTLTTDTQKKMYKEAAEVITANLADVQSAYKDVMSDTTASQKQKDQALKSLVSGTKKAYDEMGKIVSAANGVDLSKYMKNLENGLIKMPAKAPKALRDAINEMNAYLEKMPQDQRMFLEKTVNNWRKVFKDGINTFYLSGKDVTLGLSKGIADGFANSHEQMRKRVDELGLVFDEKQQAFTFKGVSLGNKIFEGLDKGLSSKKLKTQMEARLSEIGFMLDAKNGQYFYKGYNIGDNIFKGIDWGLPRDKLVKLLEEKIKGADQLGKDDPDLLGGSTGTMIANNIITGVKSGNYAEAMAYAQRMLKMTKDAGNKEGMKVSENIISKLKAGDYKGAMAEVNRLLTLPKNAGGVQGANWGRNFMTNLPKAIQDILAGKTPGKGSILERNYGKNFGLETAKMAQDIANKIIVSNAQPKPEYNQYINVLTKDVTTVSSLSKIKQRGAFLQ